MKTEIKEIYKCEFCNKLYQVKKSAIKHELQCWKNPLNNRPCFNCNHLVKNRVTVYENYYGEDNERSVDLLYCNKKLIFLYPPKVELKGNAFDLDEINEPMPKQCDIYDSESHNHLPIF